MTSDRTLADFDPADPSSTPTGAYLAAFGMTVVEASGDAAAVRWDGPVGETAAYTAAVETTCSVGAAVWWGTEAGGRAVGMSNHTTVFDLDTVGPFTARATPVDRGRVQQLWRCEITDGAGRLCASGEVLMANLS
ncbi:PaaI family thioesterase [Jatrophihabitans sp. YIM 134969]